MSQEAVGLWATSANAPDLWVAQDGFSSPERWVAVDLVPVFPIATTTAIPVHATVAASLTPYHYSSRIQFKVTATAPAPIYPSISAMEQHQHHPVVMLQQQELQQAQPHSTVRFDHEPARVHQETIQQQHQNSFGSLEHGIRQHELLVQARVYKPIPSWVPKHTIAEKPATLRHLGQQIYATLCKFYPHGHCTYQDDCYHMHVIMEQQNRIWKTMGLATHKRLDIPTLQFPWKFCDKFPRCPDETTCLFIHDIRARVVENTNPPFFRLDNDGLDKKSGSAPSVPEDVDAKWHPPQAEHFEYRWNPDNVATHVESNGFAGPLGPTSAVYEKSKEQEEEKKPRQQQQEAESLPWPWLWQQHHQQAQAQEHGTDAAASTAEEPPKELPIQAAFALPFLFSHIWEYDMGHNNPLVLHCAQVQSSNI